MHFGSSTSAILLHAVPELHPMKRVPNLLWKATVSAPPLLPVPLSEHVSSTYIG